jgi:hypothetical protein
MSAPALYTTKSLALELCTTPRQIGRWTAKGMQCTPAAVVDTDNRIRHINVYCLTACWQWLTDTVLSHAAARRQPFFQDLLARCDAPNTPDGIALLTAFMTGVEQTTWYLAESSDGYDEVSRCYKARR